jgi:hypothetical protein
MPEASGQFKIGDWLDNQTPSRATVQAGNPLTLTIWQRVDANEALQVIHRIANRHPQTICTQLERQECRYWPVLLHHRNPGIGPESANCLDIGKRLERVMSLWCRLLEAPPTVTRILNPFSATAGS